MEKEKSKPTHNNESVLGKEHPLLMMAQKAYKIFQDLGFEIAYGPELEEEKYNFDGDQIKQVFINLITNACEATEESRIKKINIILFLSNNKLNIEICDTGCGIKDDDMSKLFVPFFTTKKIGKGTGLGLAISYGIVKMHTGNIEVKSKINEGSTFTIQLPAQQEIKKIMTKELLKCN